MEFRSLVTVQRWYAPHSGRCQSGAEREGCVWEGYLHVAFVEVHFWEDVRRRFRFPIAGFRLLDLSSSGNFSLCRYLCRLSHPSYHQFFVT